MPFPLKTVSQIQIEAALAKALTELTGREFTVNIRSMEATGNHLKDRNTLNLIVESDYTMFDTMRERNVEAQEENVSA
jgi:hypothetical protein